jgi:REP element-mobilizing transposase RayT/AraC-like DNA-binding protein
VADRERFLATLEEAVNRYGWRLYAYCLMGNHYHLVVETPRPELIRGVRHVNGVYAKRFNATHRRVGHLFQARYKAILVERESHLAELLRYVVLNPVRAGLCEFPEDYRWSSYRSTGGLEQAPGFLALDAVLSLFARKRRLAQLRYRSFVADGVASEPWLDLRGQIYLGSDGFAELMAKRAQASDSEIARSQREPAQPPLRELLSLHGERAILVAYRDHGYRLRELADHLGCHYSTVSRKLRNLEAEMR